MKTPHAVLLGISIGMASTAAFAGVNPCAPSWSHSQSGAKVSSKKESQEPKAEASSEDATKDKKAD